MFVRLQLPNSNEERVRAPQDGNIDDDEEEAEVMADVTAEDMDGRLENLTQRSVT